MPATVFRTAILYIVVTVAIRLMGKRQIGDMQPNELVITLLISEIAAIPLQDTNQPVLNGVAAISVLIVLEILVSSAALKSGVLRRLINGRAVIIIKDGKLDQKAMKSLRLTADDLLEMLRGKDIFDINEVEFAVLEVNGELNVLQKAENKTVTLKDAGINATPSYPFLPILSDGSAVKENLRFFGLSEGEIDNIIKGNQKRDGIFLLLYAEDGNYEIIEKEKKK